MGGNGLCKGPEVRACEQFEKQRGSQCGWCRSREGERVGEVAREGRDQGFVELWEELAFPQRNTGATALI